MNNEIYLAYAIGAAYLFAVYKLAIYKNRSPWIWLALCFIFTPILFLVLIFMKKIPKGYNPDDAFSSSKKNKKNK
ncbi:hypothetical protein ACIJYD_03425 [Candidatus Pelagibacter bacterium nBUS_33]|uniref:hypothetical protein n=1 Tax=Candidatus Pelagibacter bacterium nBUS_33 TaxID=3374193 RepID=UPI003EBC9027